MVTQVCSSSFWKDTPVVVDEGISEVQGTTGSACDDAQNSSGQSKRTKKKKKKKKATDGQVELATSMHVHILQLRGLW